MANHYRHPKNRKNLAYVFLMAGLKYRDILLFSSIGY